MDNNFPLGLGEPPTTVYLFVEASDDTGDGRTPWHTYDFDSEKKIAINKTALYGYLYGIYLKIKEYKGKEGFKIVYQFKTPRKYFIQSGVETTFSRKLLLSLDLVKDFSQPLCVSAYVGDSESVVFSTLWDIQGNIIKAEWDETRKLLPIVQELQKRLGCEVQDIAKLRQAHAESKKNGGRK